MKKHIKKKMYRPIWAYNCSYCSSSGINQHSCESYTNSFEKVDEFRPRFQYANICVAGGRRAVSKNGQQVISHVFVIEINCPVPFKTASSVVQCLNSCYRMGSMIWSACAKKIYVYSSVKCCECHNEDRASFNGCSYWMINYSEQMRLFLIILLNKNINTKLSEYQELI